MDDDLLRDLRGGRYVSRRVREGSTGVRSSLAVSKRDLLLFDALVITNFEAQLDAAIQGMPHLVADIEFLAEQEFLFVGTSTPLELGERLGRDLSVKAHESPDEGERLASWLASAIRHPSLDEEVTIPWPLPSAAIVEALSLRLVGAKSVPVFEPGVTYQELRTLTPTFQLPESYFRGARSEQLVEVILEALPVPGDNVPLQDVLEFSRDSSTREKRIRLSRVLERAQRKHVPAKIFRLDLEDAVDEYRMHLKLHDMRAHGSTVTFLLAIPGVVEELLHLRPKRAAEQLFSLRERNVARLEKELLTPGHQYSLIYEAEKRFRRR